jgi:hypothetical protein
MTARYIRLAEVCERFAIDEDLVRIVETEKLVEIKHPADADPCSRRSRPSACASSRS